MGYFAVAPRASPGAPRGPGPSVVLAQMKAAVMHTSLLISVTPENQNCRTLCWISDRGGLAVRGTNAASGLAAAARAASFLKHHCSGSETTGPAAAVWRYVPRRK